MDSSERSGAGTVESDRTERVLVLNPASGDGEHVDHIRELADEHRFAVRMTEEGGDAVAFAREAAEAGASFVAAAGGDGTLNAVVRGLDEADAFEQVTFGVVPAGTGNNFAKNVGVTGIEQAFEVMERGDERRIDVGTADETLFLNSCIGGLTANASGETSSEMKRRFGVLAYVVSGLRTATSFDGLELDVRAGPGGEGESQWSGEAIFVLVGNGRRFPVEGRTQANMEDGLLDVTIIEQVPTRNLLEEAAAQRLLGRETEHITRLKAPSLRIASRTDDDINFSLDGEMRADDDLALSVRPSTLRIRVGDEYDPGPGE